MSLSFRFHMQHIHYFLKEEREDRNTDNAMEWEREKEKIDHASWLTLHIQWRHRHKHTQECNTQDTQSRALGHWRKEQNILKLKKISNCTWQRWLFWLFLVIFSYVLFWWLYVHLNHLISICFICVKLYLHFYEFEHHMLQCLVANRWSNNKIVTILSNWTIYYINCYWPILGCST